MTVNDEAEVPQISINLKNVAIHINTLILNNFVRLPKFYLHWLESSIEVNLWEISMVSWWGRMISYCIYIFHYMRVHGKFCLEQKHVKTLHLER